ncbi:MAG: type II toxin-antitoxin system VapC family toxin [Stellaceae bacterium]
MRLLLDTHALLWWISGFGMLSQAARAAIGDQANEIVVSAASAWEITTKFRLGKLPGVGAMANDVGASVAGLGFFELPVTLRHAQHAGSLPGPHRDPFDRLLMAQSLLEAMPLVSIDRAFDTYGVTRLW